MSNIKNFERTQELLFALAALAVMLIVPHVDAYRTVQDDIMRWAFYLGAIGIAGGDLRSTFLPVLRAIAERTPTKADDEALDIIFPEESTPKAG